MKKIFFCAFIIISLFFVSFSFLNVAEAEYFATDYVYLYENGQRINDDSSIFLVSYKSHSERCKNGICLIGQQLYPVTVYKTKNEDTLTFPEFSSQHPYQGDKYDGAAKDSWHIQKKEDYLKYLEEGSYYFVSFDPGPSEGGEVALPEELGGRIGDDRYYALEIDNGSYRQISGEPTKIFKENKDITPFTKKFFWKKILSSDNIVYLLVFILVLALVICFVKR